MFEELKKELAELKAKVEGSAEAFQSGVRKELERFDARLKEAEAKAAAAEERSKKGLPELVIPTLSQDDFDELNGALEQAEEYRSSLSEASDEYQSAKDSLDEAIEMVRGCSEQFNDAIDTVRSTRGPLRDRIIAELKAQRPESTLEEIQEELVAVLLAKSNPDAKSVRDLPYYERRNFCGEVNWIFDVEYDSDLCDADTVEDVYIDSYDFSADAIIVLGGVIKNPGEVEAESPA